jgi:hypothetical protein
MSRNSYRDMLADWQKLTAAVRGGETDLPILIPYRMGLETHLESVQAAKVRQTLLEADRELATLELRHEIAAGRDHIIRLRSQVKAALGPRDERLRDFGIAPIGKRPRKPPQEDPHEG